MDSILFCVVIAILVIFNAITIVMLRGALVEHKDAKEERVLTGKEIELIKRSALLAGNKAVSKNDILSLITTIRYMVLDVYEDNDPYVPNDPYEDIKR